MPPHTPSSCLAQPSPDGTIRESLVQLECKFFTSIGGDLVALNSFLDMLSQLEKKIEMSKHQITDDTLQRVASFADTVKIVTSSVLDLEATSELMTQEVSSEVSKVLAGLGELTLEDNPLKAESPTESSILLPYIKTSYDWLLSNLHNPYPSKEVRSYIAQSHSISRKLVDAWFVDARKRVGWNSLCKAHFETRKDMIDAATAFFQHIPVASCSTQPQTSPSTGDLAVIFITLETRAKNLYSSKLERSELEFESSFIGRKRSGDRDDGRPAKRKRHSSAYPSPPASAQGSPEPASHSREPSQEREDSSICSIRKEVADYQPLSPVSTADPQSPSPPVTPPVTSHLSRPLSSKRKRSTSCTDREETPISKRARRNISAPVVQPTNVVSLPAFDSWTTPVDVESFDFSIDTPPAVTVMPLAENVEWDTSSYEQFVAALQRDHTPELSEAGSSPYSAASPGLVGSPASEPPNLDFTTYQDPSNQAGLSVEPEPLIFDNSFNNTFYPDPFSTLLQPSVHYDMSLAPLNLMPETWLSPLEPDNLNTWSLPSTDKGYSTFITPTDFCQPASIMQDEQAAKRLRAQQLREELRRLEQDFQA